MTSKALAGIASCLVSAALLSQAALAQRGGGGAQGGGQGGGQPAGVRDYSVPEIPGVIAAGAQWKLVWGGNDNADGLVGMADGSLLFAQEQPNRVSKVDANDKVTPFIEDTHGAGALAIDAKGQIWAAMRTCTDPGGKPDECKTATAIGTLKPAYKVLTDNFEGKTLGRVNDLVVAKNGGVYFNGTGTFYVNPAGKTFAVGNDLRTNGILLSRDEKTLYVTNNGAIVALDVQADGTTTNQREFGKLQGGGGDGMTIDSEGRLYVTTNAGVQVLGTDGKLLGVIGTPRGVISVAFAGPDKKTMYVVGSGATINGQEYKTPEGVRNNGKSIFKITTIAQGFKGRAK